MSKEESHSRVLTGAKGIVNDRLGEIREKTLGEDIAQTVAGSLGKNWAKWFHGLSGDDGKCSGCIRVMYANQEQNSDALKCIYAAADKKLARAKEGQPVSKKAMEKLEHCLQIALNNELLDIAYKADPTITRNLEAANWLRAKYDAGEPLVDPNNSTCNLAVGGQS